MRLDAHNLNVLMNETIRNHIKACGSKIGRVAFYKKDGSIRHLSFQLAAMPARILGTERGKKASDTRSLNHPNLLTVWDIQKGAFRSVNLDTVLTVRCGSTTRYRRPRPIAGLPGAAVLDPVFRVSVGVIENDSVTLS